MVTVSLSTAAYQRLEVMAQQQKCSPEQAAERLLTGSVPLDESSDEARAFLEDMKALQTIHLELGRLDRFDTLCRTMVLLAREHLRIDRIGVFLMQRQGQLLQGTYGTDLQGQLRDESYYSEAITEGHWTQEVMDAPKKARLWVDAPLMDDGQVVKQGWKAAAALWTGQDIVGFLICDNSLTGDPPRPYITELLSVLGSTFAYLIERQRSDEALRQREQLISQVLRTVPSFIYIYDLVEDRNVMANEGLTRLLGYTPQELQAMGNNAVPSLIHPEDLPQILDYIERIRESTDDGYWYYASYRLLHKEGHYVWIKDQGAVFKRTEDGEVVQILGSVVDISERKSAEDALTGSEERLWSIIENIPIMIAFFDEMGRFTFVNRHWREVLGWTIEELSSLPDPLEAFYPDPQLRCSVLEFMLAAEGRWKDFSTLTKQRQVIQTSWANIRLSDGRTIGIGQDVTRLRQAQRQEFELALEKERINLLTEFIRDASHEFRTPLATISTSVHLMTRLDAEQRVNKAHKIQGQVQRITRLLDMLLMLVSLEKRRTLELEVLHVRDLLAALCDKVRTTQRDAATLVLNEIADDLLIMGDAVLLSEALKQILENAIQFTPSEGRVRVSALAEFGRVYVYIDDSGSGIAPEDLPRVFDTFWRQTVKGVEGFGLGLTIAKRIIDLHGGQMQLISVIDQGTRAIISLPMHAH